MPGNAVRYSATNASDPKGRSTIDALRIFHARNAGRKGSDRVVAETASRFVGILPDKAASRPNPERLVSTDVPRFSYVEGVTEGDALRLKRIDVTDHSAAEAEICRMLSYPSVKRLAISDLKSLEERRFVAAVVSRNFPLLEVGRLIPGHSIANVSFSGVKKLNDRYGQAFTDHVVDAAKRLLMRDFVRASGRDAANWRVIRDDYKNFTVSLPDWSDPVKTLFGNTAKVSHFVDQVLSLCEKDVAALSKARGIPERKIAAMVRRDFGISLGVSRVPEDGSDRSKLSAFREAELASKPLRSSGKIAASEFGSARTLELARAALAIESSIIRNWEGKRFVMGGVEYPTIVRFRSEPRISPELLRTVRKNGEAEGAVSPAELQAQVREYLTALNSGFDFISPVRADTDFATAAALDAALRSGIVPKEAFLTTFKGADTKRSFYAKTEGREGVRIFADVKDMGLMNFASFRRAAEEVVRSEDGNNPSVLMAGFDVTRAFADTVTEIRQRLPESEIALGGDEILVFLPAASGISQERASAIVVESISSHGLACRVAHASGKGGKESFASLDRSTAVHKAAEEEFSKAIAHKGLPVPEPRAVVLHGGVPASFDPTDPEFLRAVSAIAKKGDGTELFAPNAANPGILSLASGRLEIRFS